MKRLILPLLLLGLVMVGCMTQKNVSPPTLSLQMHQFEDLDSLMAVDSKPVAVFLHAPWCTFCKNMEQTTFANQEIIQQLNKQFYFISFDGESKDEVAFRGKTFVYKPRGRGTGTHELATALGSKDGTLAYPSFVVLNSGYEIVFQHNAFLRAMDMEIVLQEVLGSL